MAAEPTAGCGVSGDGYGYPDHVGTFLLAKRVLGRLSDLSYKVRRPRGPSRLAKAGRRGHFFLINVRGHPTFTAMFQGLLGATCRHPADADRGPRQRGRRKSWAVPKRRHHLTSIQVRWSTVE
ncbi:hypothetical protein GCM10010330_67370 [Streptomyces tendae]|nr:hypothetical protein GCM10010330_67370 [Streptomyces tendae]